MKNNIIIIFGLFILLFFSCKKKELEFFKSEPTGNIILLKNHLNYSKEITYFSFYKYTSDTKYFLKNKEIPNGFSRNLLSDHIDDKIAIFSISKCKNDSTKLVGELFYYGYDRNKKQDRDIDTLIYNCY